MFIRELRGMGLWFSATGGVRTVYPFFRTGFKDRLETRNITCFFFAVKPKIQRWVLGRVPTEGKLFDFGLTASYFQIPISRAVAMKCVRLSPLI